MRGYIVPDRPGEILPPQEGWHDTGDIVTLDADGFVTIKGRVKRFAKVGGEMVSLAAVEGYACAVWPENRHAAVAVPDSRKGERVILITDVPDADTAALMAWAQANGAPEIALPKKIVPIREIPVLGTGKTDYVAVQKIAEDEIARVDAA
jgi:acyl-[acyl-carrier-protein]-phospholipid O-acyltransferase/long-chain-fatty-acid--[acyl-carrier-protein] ligase